MQNIMTSLIQFLSRSNETRFVNTFKFIYFLGVNFVHNLDIFRFNDFFSQRGFTPLPLPLPLGELVLHFVVAATRFILRIISNNLFIRIFPNNSSRFLNLYSKFMKIIGNGFSINHLRYFTKLVCDDKLVSTKKFLFSRELQAEPDGRKLATTSLETRKFFVSYLGFNVPSVVRNNRFFSSTSMFKGKSPLNP
jgi:hypothetical protein